MVEDRPRLTWIVPSADAGGIGPVSLETAAAVAAGGACDVTLIETHAAPRRDWTAADGLHRIAFDMGGTGASAAIVLDWLRANQQTLVFTNDVSHLHGMFLNFPKDTMHVAVIHDAARRYRDDVLSYAQHLEGMVAVSDYVFGWLQKDPGMAAFSGPIRRIHNGTSYPPIPQRTEWAGLLRLLFIGDAWLKGGSRLSGVVRALRRHGVDFQLTVISADPKRLQHRLRGAAPEGRITFMPRCSRAELWRIYAEHDVLLMLSVGEPFGMVTVEAMGMGCVPVGYDVPSGMREIIEPGLSGLLVPCRHQAVAAAIAELSRSRSRLKSMSKGAVLRARTAFTAQRTAQEYLQVVEELTHRRARTQRLVRAADTNPASIMPRSRSPIVQLYHLLPLSVRHGIRTALSANPASFRWLRERF